MKLFEARINPTPHLPRIQTISLCVDKSSPIRADGRFDAGYLIYSWRLRLLAANGHSTLDSLLD